MLVVHGMRAAAASVPDAVCFFCSVAQHVFTNRAGTVFNTNNLPTIPPLPPPLLLLLLQEGLGQPF
jgi:hypothetical protein